MTIPFPVYIPSACRSTLSCTASKSNCTSRGVMLDSVQVCSAAMASNSRCAHATCQPRVHPRMSHHAPTTLSCVGMHTRTNTHTRTHTRTYTHTRAHIHARIYVHIYTHTHICTHTHIHTQITRTHKHAHTRAQGNRRKEDVVGHPPPELYTQHDYSVHECIQCQEC